MKQKDKRIIYDNEKIEVNGNVIRFDGKGDKEKKEVKIYRMHGDVTLFDEAIQNFCMDNGYETAIRKF